MSTRPVCVEPETGRLLASYELGLLDPQEQILFEEHLILCAACQEDIYEMAPAMERIRTEAKGLASLVGEGRETEPLLQAKPAGGRAPSPSLRERIAGFIRIVRPETAPARAWRILMPVAAVAGILIVVVLHPREVGTWEALADLRPPAYVRIPIRSGAAGAMESRFRDGMDRYVEERYAEAATMLAAALRLERSGADPMLVDQALLYAGVSFLLAGSADSAETFLAAASRSAFPATADHARWYLGQSRLLRDDPPGARRMLEELAAASPRYAAAARRQIQAIDEELARRGPRD